MNIYKCIPSMVLGLAMNFTSFGAAAAAIVGLQVEGGGTAQIFQLDNGNLLGLWGIDNREGANPGAGAVSINSAADLVAGFTSNAASIVNFYEGTNPINAGASEFDLLEFGFSVADNARLFDSIWIEWTGGNLVYGQPSGGTATMGTTVTRQGDPLAANAVPVPATLGLLGLGLVALGAARRGKRQVFICFTQGRDTSGPF